MPLKGKKMGSKLYKLKKKCILERKYRNYMKLWKNTLITAFAFIGISSTVLYTACVKDACADLKCQNNGTCTDGFCHCPTGYEGTECELLSTDRFQGVWVGTSVINTKPVDVIPTLYDTVSIFVTYV